MTLPAAARYLGISEKSLRRLLPRIVHYRLGGPRGVITFDRADLDAYRESCRVEPKGARKTGKVKVKDWCGEVNERTQCDTH